MAGGALELTSTDATARRGIWLSSMNCGAEAMAATRTRAR
jgi:hypothetical protein